MKRLQKVNPTAEMFYRMIRAIRSCDFDTMERCLSRRMDINITDRHGNSLLWHACQMNALEAAKWLIAHDINVNLSSTKYGETALMIAAETDFVMLQTLLDAGADVTIEDHEGSVAAIYSICAQKEEAFHLLMTSKPDINALFNTRTDKHYSYYSQPFVVRYIEGNHNQLTSENRIKWNKIRLKNIFSSKN